MTQTFEELGNTLKGALEIIHAREAEIRKLDAELAEKDRRIAELEGKQSDAASLLASATDLLNSWAREMAVKEAYDESDIKGVIDRLWNELSMEMSRSAQKGALLRNWLKESPNKSVENVLSAIEGK